MAALIGRRRRRGAAMVEGVVALLVLVTFFGALLFVFRAQENRLDVQAGAHADARPERPATTSRHPTSQRVARAPPRRRSRARASNLRRR